MLTLDSSLRAAMPRKAELASRTRPMTMTYMLREIEEPRDTKKEKKERYSRCSEVVMK